MGIITKDRTRIHVRGLGNMSILLKEPTADSAFSSVGYLKGTTITDAFEQEDIQPETGHTIDRLTRSRDVMVETNLQQTTLEEIALARDAEGKVYAVRYYGLTYTGRFQYFCAEQAKFEPGIRLPFQPGERLIPVKIKCLAQDLTYETSELYQAETDGLLSIDSLQLWASPRVGLNAATSKVLEISGWARHGDLSADYASIWQANTYPTLPDRYFRFDGSNDSVNFGNILNDDASGDFIIELWMKFPTGGAQEEVLSKKTTLVSDNSAGFAIYKTAGNLISFRLSNGSTSVTATTTNTVLTAWKHYLIAVDRNGNATPYLNGAADGTPQNVSSLSSGTNSANLYLGRDATNYGQVDVGDVRIYRYAAGGLPATAAFALAHYNAEKTRYGV